MPLKSKAQMRWMAANRPEMLRRWAAHTKSVKKLPEHVGKSVPRKLRDLPRPTATTRIAQKYSTVPFGNPRDFARSDFPHTPAEGLAGVRRKNVEAGYMASRLNAHHRGRDRGRLLAMEVLKPGGSNRSMAREVSRRRLGELETMTKAETEFAPIAQHRLVQRKKKQKHLSEASAALGLTALAAKAPAGAAAITRRFPKYGKPLKRVAEMAPKADKLSANIVPASLGVGAIGSMNFARLQGQEAKAAPTQKATTPVKKDAFTRKYSQHISPAAEDAYNDLGARRRRRNSDAVLYGAGAVGAAGTAGRALTVKLPAGNKVAQRAARATVAVPLAAVAGGLGYGAVRRYQEGQALQERRNKIKAKGMERHMAGQYGRGRPKPQLSEMSKAFGMGGVRPGGLMRTATGKTVTRRGGIPGTGKFVPTIRRQIV